MFSVADDDKAYFPSLCHKITKSKPPLNQSISIDAGESNWPNKANEQIK